ncbi:Protein ABHD1 [Portunus trituberculatus]|uniref:Protein ABHD1 n=1 Tax=Portunus trituberculatus TaxID=210409 RepID=A0A5B7JL69_PORTR|nr:Protein ABHD1 [Portunus trituberculatus]
MNTSFISTNSRFIHQGKTVREFDSRFIAVQVGFRDVEDYYRTACLHGKLHLNHVPHLCLSAADDPFQPLQGIFSGSDGSRVKEGLVCMCGVNGNLE